MGFFDIFKSKPFISMDLQKNMIINLVINRLIKFGGIDINTKKRIHIDKSDLKEESKGWNKATIFGFPEGTIFTIITNFLFYRIHQTFEANKSLHLAYAERVKSVNYPAGYPDWDFSMREFILYRIRIENPTWSADNISDEECYFSIDDAMETLYLWSKDKYNLTLSISEVYSSGSTGSKYKNFNLR